MEFTTALEFKISSQRIYNFYINIIITKSFCISKNPCKTYTYEFYKDFANYSSITAPSTFPMLSEITRSAWESLEVTLLLINTSLLPL